MVDLLTLFRDVQNHAHQTKLFNSQLLAELIWFPLLHQHGSIQVLETIIFIKA